MEDYTLQEFVHLCLNTSDIFAFIDRSQLTPLDTIVDTPTGRVEIAGSQCTWKNVDLHMIIGDLYGKY